MKRKVENVWAELSAKQDAPQESTELSEEVKVELANAKVLNNLYRQIDNKIDAIKAGSESAALANRNLRQAMETGRGAVRDFRSTITDVEADIQRLDSAMKSFEKSIADLGMSPKDSPDWNGANAMMQQAQDVVSKYERQMKELVKTFSL
jgi:chromosome segregation ATPase